MVPEGSGSNGSLPFFLLGVEVATKPIKFTKRECRDGFPPGTPYGPMGLPITYNQGRYLVERKKRQTKAMQRRKRYKSNKLLELPSVF